MENKILLILCIVLVIALGRMYLMYKSEKRDRKYWYSEAMKNAKEYISALEQWSQKIKS